MIGPGPVAARVVPYALPTVPLGRLVVVMVTAPAPGATVIESGWVVVAPPRTSLTVKKALAWVVGVPLITPVVLARTGPAGGLPADSVHVVAPVPVAASVALYAEPTVAAARLVVVIAKAPAAETLTENCFVTLLPPAPTGFSLNDLVPAAVGVPDRMPLAPFRLSPGGEGAGSRHQRPCERAGASGHQGDGIRLADLTGGECRGGDP